MAAGRPYLSIVIPAYNEEDRLGVSLPLIEAYLQEHQIDAEILVADDGSTDGTASMTSSFLRGKRGRVLRSPENRGKGAAVRRGVLEAQGRWVLMTDADLSTPIEEHARLAEIARDEDLDVVFGSRGLPESQVEIRQNWLRQLMGRTFNWLLRTITGLPYRDTQCGFKLFDRQRTLPLFERMVVDHFAFDVELLFLCDRFGLRVKEVPVVWRNSERSTVNVVAAPPEDAAGPAARALAIPPRSVQSLERGSPRNKLDAGSMTGRTRPAAERPSLWDPLLEAPVFRELAQRVGRGERGLSLSGLVVGARALLVSLLQHQRSGAQGHLRP